MRSLLLGLAMAMCGCTQVIGLDQLQRDPSFDPDAAPTPPATGGGDAAAMDASRDATDAAADVAASTCPDPGSIAFGGHCYFLLADAKSWVDAKNACAAAGAHLVTLTSSDEQAAVAKLEPTLQRWIGLSRVDTSPATKASYEWVTGEPQSYDNWYAKEPDGSGTCVRMKEDGQWYDRPCDVVTPDSPALRGICERE